MIESQEGIRLIKKYAISIVALMATCAQAGFGGMGNVDGEYGNDLSVQEMMFMLLGLAVIYGIMKKTSIGQSVEDFCGPIWGMVVLSIGALFVVGIAGMLMRS